MEIPVFMAAPPAATIVAAVVAGLIGGFVRGCSGFGFALAAVPVLTLAMHPAQAVPAVLPLEALLGLATVPSERGSVSWPVVKWLVAGTLVGTPLGVAVLATAPASLMRLVVTGMILIGVAILWRGPTLAGLLQLPWLPLIGFVSGCLNGGAAMSGPPAIVALLASPLSPRAARATLMAFITASAMLAGCLVAARGLYDANSAVATASMMPAGIFGSWAGSRTFGLLPPDVYRRMSLAILTVVTLGVFVLSL